MRTINLILGIMVTASSVLCTTVFAQNVYQSEYQRAIQGALSNVQNNGAVVASPSRVQPDYYYDWVRDTSLTMKNLVEIAYDAKTSPNLRSDLLARIDRWIEWELNLQVTPKTVEPGIANVDLGEPRFYLNGTTNMEPWGRPQNDGPALRAQTAMLVANKWIDDGRISDVNAKLYKGVLPATTLIKRDLEYVAHHWQNQSIDLWEEERGMHFYTLTVQKAALSKGAVLANRLGDASGANFYAAQAKAIDQYLQRFFDKNTGTYVYALDVGKRLPQKTTMLDISILLAAIETYDGQFYVPISKLMPTVQALVAKFTTEYKINSTMTKNKKGEPLGIALGRYPGDVYSGFDFSGGNPWFLSTLALAEFACDMNKVANHTQALAQFNRVLYHMNASGDLSEQFNRTSGFEQGAHDLTWSYTAYMTAYRACF